MMNWTLLALFACGSPPPSTPPVAEGKATNVILIIADTVRADHLDTYGYERPTSPELTKFAAGGAVFDRAYTHAPWTKPSIATMLTSRTPRDHGITQWESVLDPAQVTLPEHLKTQGFTTTAYVSHHALTPKKSNFEQGFDTYDTTVVQKGDPHKVLSSEDITDLGIAYLDNPPDGRWMLMLHYFDPHIDYRKHREWDFGVRPIDRYDSEIAFMDHHLGRFFDALEAKGTLENTVVAFVADHGDEFMEHGKTQHTVQLWEEVIHIPWVMRGPGIEPHRVGTPVGLVDLAPTLTSILDVPASPEFRGVPIPLANRRFDAPDTPVISETRRVQNRRAVMHGQYKLIVDLRRNETLLFDIDADPKEKNDIAADHPDVVEKLRGFLDDYIQAAETTAPQVAMDDETRLALQQLGYLTEEGDEDKVDVDWVAIEGGRFSMGHKKDRGHAAAWPVHEVAIPDFEIMRNEITTGQYRACVASGVCVMPPNTCDFEMEPFDLPMLCLSSREAGLACEWLGGRLPSESEWEYAARSGGKDRRFPWGADKPDCSRISGPVGDCDTPHPVCTKTAGNTAQGVCDMAGNALEWTADAWEPNYNGAPLDGRPRVKPGDNRKVLRGGGVRVKMPQHTRARMFRGEDYSQASAGARCVRNAPAE